jgi:hypothetical protein
MHVAAMPTHRGQSKKLARQKARRADIKKKQAKADAARAPQALIRRAQEFPIEKTWLSDGWRDTNEELPELVTALMLRRRGITNLVGMALVDRTCLGVKSGFVRVVTDEELARLLAQTRQMHGGIEEVDLHTWQSVVFHAIDFARSLGFEPDPDFPVSFMGPRPDVLLDTPLGMPSRPIYAAGPDDAPRAIISRLMDVRGRDFRAIVGSDPDHPVLLDPARGELFEPLYDEDDDEAELDEDLDEDELDESGG